VTRETGLITQFKNWDKPQGDPNVVREFKAVAERISAVPKSLSAQEKEDLYLAVFLANTEFRLREPAIAQLNARAAEFAEKGRMVRDGWMLTRIVEFNRPSWRLQVAP
jgi:hypothetical protein